jgi:hypothetical protein
VSAFLTGVGGAILLLATLTMLLLWKKRVPKITAILMLGVGSGLTGVLLGIAALFADVAGILTGGVTVVMGIVTLALAFVVIHDLWPRHSADAKTAYAALALPVFAAGAGGGVIPELVRHVTGGVAGGAASVMSHLF